VASAGLDPEGYVVGSGEEIGVDEAENTPEAVSPGLLAEVASSGSEPLRGRAARRRLRGIGPEEDWRSDTMDGDLPAGLGPDDAEVFLNPPSEEARAAGYVAGADDEFDVSVEENTDPSLGEFGLGDEATSEAGGPAAPRDPLFDGEWKLKATGGLTYNFHGLDALLSWAANKAGLSMKISVDGQLWRDFGGFNARLRGGQAAAEAFELADLPLGGIAPAAETAATGEPGAATIDTIQAMDARTTDDVAVLARGERGRDRGVTEKLNLTLKPEAPAPGNGAGHLTRGDSRKVTTLPPAGRAAGTLDSSRIVVIGAGFLALVIITTVVLYFTGVIELPWLNQ
jgi:hypothetical protein